MKTKVLLFLIVFLCSCGDDDPLPEPIDKVTFNGEEIEFDVSNAFETEDGYLLRFQEVENGAVGAELFILISDKDGLEYSGTENLNAQDSAKFIAFFKDQDETLHRSIEGTFNFFTDPRDPGNKTILTGRYNISVGLVGIGTLTEGVFTNVEIKEMPFADFTQISPTDDFGVALGTEDPTDWQTNDNWNTLEEGLFLQFSTPANTSNATDVSCFPIFPNSFSDTFGWSFSSPTTPNVQIIVINENFEVIQTYTDFMNLDSGNSLLFFQLEPMVAKDRFYRMYYQIISGSTVAKGHGDLHYVQ